MPGGGGGTDTPVVNVRFQLRQDGSLDGEPVLVAPQSSPLYSIAADASIRAIKQCAPFQLPPDKYGAWSTVTWEFDLAGHAWAGATMISIGRRTGSEGLNHARRHFETPWLSLGAVGRAAVSARRRAGVRAAPRRQLQGTDAGRRSRQPVREMSPQPTPSPGAAAAMRRRLGGGLQGRDAGHHRADSDRHSGLPRADPKLAPTSPTSSPPISNVRVCSSRSTAPRSSSRCATSMPRRAFPTGASSTPTRSSSATSARRRRPHRRRVPLVGRAAGRQLAGAALRDERAELAPRRPPHRRSGLRATHRREGLLRHPRRVRRRDRAQGPARQAARDHGPGRPQRPPARARDRSSCSRRASVRRTRKSPSCRTRATSRACSC